MQDPRAGSSGYARPRKGVADDKYRAAGNDDLFQSVWLSKGSESIKKVWRGLHGWNLTDCDEMASITHGLAVDGLTGLIGKSSVRKQR